MKQPYLWCLLLLALNPIRAAAFEQRELKGKTAEQYWQGASHIWLKQENTIPAFVEFRDGCEPDENFFFAYMQKRFLLPVNYSVQLITSETDVLGIQHKRYQLLVAGVPVNNGVFILHLLNGKVKKFNGYLFKQITTGTTPAISEQQALNAALSAIGATTYKWQIADEEQFIRMETGDPAATYKPKGELFIVQKGDNTSTTFSLAWRFDIYAQQPLSRDYVFVDAQTGEVIKKSPRLYNVDAPGAAVTVYRGNRSIVADSYNGAYRLQEASRGLGIRTLNMQKGTSHNAAVNFIDSDNVWNNVNANLDQYAGDAHWGGEMTYDFYQSMGRNSIDGNGYRLTLYVHYDQSYYNAFWDGQSMNFGDGDGTVEPLTSLDIAGHEISHGLDERTANLDYQDESGALNESFSDIFGTAVEWYADSTVANWLIGEDIGSALRNMSNPNATGDPDTYHGTHWYSGTQDNGGVHTNSNVQNHWYYRLAQGGSGTNDIGSAYNVTGIGRHKATQIAWRDMVYYLTNSADYADSRFYSIQAANDLFGPCSPEATSTTNAWYAVGVGGPFVFGVDAQFTPNPGSGCTVPFTVSFTNTTSNGSSYTWDFGDGTTSTSANPSHTYTSFGNYTVKLIADGGACGVDSINSNPISVNAANPCVVILPQTGTYQTQTACSGTLLDNGGASGNYSDNSNSTVTISPAGAAKVTVSFTQFGMESSYDYVYIYDGPNTSSPLLASYTGTTLPASVTSTGPSITVKQYSDQAVNDVGFTMQWTCVNPTTIPTANFKADVTESCSGLIHFTDLTTGGVNSWDWDFGDGNTSSDQHPVHLYTSSGTYTVSLTAHNSFGPNTVTKTNYIVVAKPSGPAAASINGCHADSFALTASTTNPVNWYDNSGTLAGTGNPFITPYLTTGTTYYAEEVLPQPIFNAGPADSTIGTGSNFNASNNRGLRYRVFKNCRLVSVFVYATGSGYRIIQQKDSAGAVIQQRTVFCPNGGSRILLNFDMIPGTYQLGLKDTLNLYRNNAGATYPYTDADGMVSIYGNNAGGNATNYYYFFYDWELQEADCISQRTAVQISVGNTAIQFTSSATDAAAGLANGTASINNISGGSAPYAVQWSNGQSGNTATGLQPGTYTATITDNSGCQQTANVVVNESVGINELGESGYIQVYPNPANQTIMLNCSAFAMQQIKVINALAQVVLLQNNVLSNQLQLDVSPLASGVYVLEVFNGQSTIKKQVVITR